jgi:DNA polymerase III subunit epsilon
MLQERINELKSAILEIEGDKVYVTGFTREEMLQRHLDNGSQCFSSKGIYNYQDLHFYNIQNHALIIVMKDGKELGRYQYKPVIKDTIRFKEFNDGEEKVLSLTFTIRKSTYSDHYHFVTEKSSLLFDNKDELNRYLLEKYGIHLNLVEVKVVDFITIDFEIANNQYNSACSMGLVFVENNKIIDKKHFYIQPPFLEFDKKMSDIHGITADHVKNERKFIEIWEEIKHYFQGSTVIIAHNAQFDMSVLHACLSEYKLELPDFPYIDSISISTVACRGEGVGNSLKERLKHFGIPLDNHHDALADAEAAAKLVIHCVEQTNKRSLDAYCRTYWSISIRNFSELKPQTSFGKSKKFNRVNLNEIEATVETFDITHVFFGKNIVFTGELQTIDRKSAMQKVADAGGILKSGVSKNTDYLVVGKQDKTVVGEDGLSTKEEKAYALIEQGVKIKIINENEFLSLL